MALSEIIQDQGVGREEKCPTTESLDFPTFTVWETKN